MKQKERLFQVIVMIVACFMPAVVMSQSELSKTVIINEVMQSTFGGNLDMLMEYPDGWIELYNPGTQNVNLGGCGIGKKHKFSKCFVLPDVTIPAKSYLLVFCDAEDTLVYSGKVLKEIHTDFKLTTDKESDVYLFASDKTLMDSIHLPAVYLPGVGYGRLADASDSLGLEMKATPGKMNQGGHGKAVLPYPVLNYANYITNVDVETGNYFTVTHVGKRNQKMSNGEPLPVSDVVCRYTLDGSEPTEESPILIRSTSKGLPIKKNTYLRTSYFLDGYVTPPSEAHVYIYHGQDIELPVVSIAVSPGDLYDKEYGILENQPKTDEEARNPIYAHNWMRPATFIYFESGGGKSQLSQKCELRVGGGYTRKNDLKSMILYADERFGTSDNFDAYFWSRTRSRVGSVPSLALRGAGNDDQNAYMRDAVAQLVFGKAVDVDWQAYQPAIYYINEKYQGIVNIRERANEDNVWTHNNGLEDITLIEITQSHPEGELKKGDYQLYRDFYDFCSKPNQSFKDYEDCMDVNEYLNMMIAEIFFGNTDFPANNNVLWRKNTEDGKWRWIMKDLDRAFGIWNFCPADGEYLKWILREESNITEDVEHNSEMHTLMFRNLINTVPEFRNKFIDYFSIYFGDFLTVNNIIYWIDFAANMVRSEMKKFKDNGFKSWEDNVSSMKTWTRNRIPAMRSQLEERFDLGNGIEAKINNAVPRSETVNYLINVNGAQLTEATFSGLLYPNREYVIEGKDKNSKYEIMAWTIVEKRGTETRSWTEFGSSVSYTADSDVTSFTVNAVRGVNGVEEHENGFVKVARVEYYNAAGQKSDEPFKGLNLVREFLENGQCITDKVYYDE